MNKQLKFLSMEDLSRLARNEGEDLALRREALHMLHSRESWLYQRHLRTGTVSKYYVPNVLSP